VSVIDWLLKTVNNIIGYDIPAIIEPNETYLNSNNTIMKTPKAHNAGMGVKAITIPNKVATPFPPLKLAKTGYMCPITAATPKASS
jgi:hypothetical protein